VGEPVRIPLYSPNQELLGYWRLKQAADGNCLVTYRYPGVEHNRIETDCPKEAVRKLYQAYVGFLSEKYRELENTLAELPAQEYRKPGFRKGWLKRLRTTLGNRRQFLVNQARKVLTEKLASLHLAGWPQTELPRLPWDRVDGKLAAAGTWLKDRATDGPRTEGLSALRVQRSTAEASMPGYARGIRDGQDDISTPERTNSWQGCVYLPRS